MTNFYHIPAEGRLRYEGATIVVKYGGAAMLSPELQESFVREIVFLHEIGAHVVVVHGGGKEITAMSEKLGLETRFVDGQRYTGEETIGVVQMTLAGKLNQDIVARINRSGGKAIGLSGLDGRLLTVQKAGGPVDLGLVGEITGVNAAFLHLLLGHRFIPVIAPVGADADGTIYNINADVAAAQVAASLQADRLMFLSDIDGVHAGGRRLERLDAEEAERLIAAGTIAGGMIPKMRSAFSAIRSGVGTVHLVDGRVRQSLLREMFSAVSLGTRLEGAGMRREAVLG